MDIMQHMLTFMAAETAPITRSNGTTNDRADNVKQVVNSLQLLTFLHDSKTYPHLRFFT